MVCGGCTSICPILKLCQIPPHGNVASICTTKYVVLSEARNTYVYVKSHNFYVTLKLLIYKPNTVYVLDLNPLGTTSCCLFQMRILDSKRNKDAGIMS